ncbi:MAG: sulfotransferase [Nitrospirota bacterium]
MDIDRPIIIIGAGRSGSTLLVNIFDKHKDIYCCGETDFLVPRLWLELWESRLWTNDWSNLKVPRKERTEKKIHVDTRKDANILYTDTDRLMLKKRVGSGISKLMAENILEVKQSHKIWGFKEIWNGSSQFAYEWEPYDYVFPNAIWVHNVRHPFDYIRSLATNSNRRITYDFLNINLQSWVSMNKYSAKRSETGRYFLVRYEDILSDLKGTLLPVFEAAGVGYDPDCEAVLSLKYAQSRNKKQPKIEDIFSIRQIINCISVVKDLIPLMIKYNYSVPGLDMPLKDLEKDTGLGLEIKLRSHLPQHYMYEESQNLKLVLSSLLRRKLRRLIYGAINILEHKLANINNGLSARIIDLMRKFNA